MTKVYAIMVNTDETDPDPHYRLAAICSSEEKAKYLMSTTFKESDCNLVGMTIDAFETVKGMNCYRVVFAGDDIRISEEHQNVSGPNTEIYNSCGRVVAIVWAKNAVDALIIAKGAKEDQNL